MAATQPRSSWAEVAADGAWKHTDHVVLRLYTDAAYGCFCLVLMTTYNVVILKQR